MTTPSYAQIRRGTKLAISQAGQKELAKPLLSNFCCRTCQKRLSVEEFEKTAGDPRCLMHQHLTRPVGQSRRFIYL
jgi:hypothetical protein